MFDFFKDIFKFKESFINEGFSFIGFDLDVGILLYFLLIFILENDIIWNSYDK